MGGWNLFGGFMPPVVDTVEEKERRHSRDSGNENQEILNISHAKDLSLENAILANFPDGCDRSFIVESKYEDSYDIIPENLTFTEIKNVLNQAVKEGNYEELNKIVQNIEGYEGRSITLDNANLRSFGEQQLNLDLQNNQHIYSNILSRYNFDQENFECDYSVKEVILLAIAANDKLVEKYQNILFAEENLNFLPLLVGGQKYIEAFIEKFHVVYDKIKDQAIQLDGSNKIGFFSAIALRKEQELLETVLVEHVLRDFEQILKTSDPDPLYGVLETASLAKNEKFIAIVLNAFENEPTKKDLLKESFVTLLKTAISQEHISIIECLCKRYINNRDCTIYEQAFADDKVIKMLNQQILKKIEARNRKEIYDLVLKTALNAGNTTFIERLCEERVECSNDVIVYLNQKLKGNELDNISVRQIIKNILKNAIHYSTNQEDYSLIKEVCYLCTESDEINVIFQEECEILKSSIKERMEDLEKKEKFLQSEALHEYNYNYLPSVVNGLAQVVHAGYNIYTEDQKCQEDPILNRLMHIRNILQFSIDVREYSYHERQGLWDQMYSIPGTFMVRKRSDKVTDRSAIPAIESDILSENLESQSADTQENVNEQMNIAEQEAEVQEREIEVAASSQAVNEENNIQLTDQEFRSADTQGNVNERENIINEATRDEQEVETETQEQEGEGRAVRVVKYGMYSSVAVALASISRWLFTTGKQTSLSQVDDNFAINLPFIHHTTISPQVMLESKINEGRKTFKNARKSAKNNFGISKDYPEPQWYKDLHKSETSEVSNAGASVATLNKKVLKETTSNNYRRGKMPKNIKTIEEKLSDSIDNINLVGMIDLLKKIDDSVYESTLQKGLDQANDQIKNLEEGEQKNNLTQIITLLEEELKKTATVLPVGDDVESIGATSSQETSVIESKESSPSLSFEEDDFSKLESDKSAGTSSSSPSFEVIDGEAETSITRVPEMAEFELAETPSIVTEGAEVELGNINDMSFSLLDSVDENISVLRSNEGAAGNSSSVSQAVHENQLGTRLFSSDNSSAKEHLGSTPSLQQSSEDNYYSCSSSVNSGQLTRAHSDSSIFIEEEDTFRELGQSDTSSSQSSVDTQAPQFAEDTGQADLNDSIADENTQATVGASVLVAGVLGAAVYKIGRGTGLFTHDSEDLATPSQSSQLGFTAEHAATVPESQSSFDNVDNHSVPYTSEAELPDDNKNDVDASISSDQGQSEIPADSEGVKDDATVLSIDVDEEEQQSAEREIAHENTQPKPMVNGQNGNENDRNVVLQSTKGTTVTTWMFAITGILAVAAAPAAYFALGTSLLVAGAVAGIGAFCIIAAIAIHYYNKSPSDSLAKPSAEAVIVNNAAVGIS